MKKKDNMKVIIMAIMKIILMYYSMKNMNESIMNKYYV